LIATVALATSPAAADNVASVVDHPPAESVGDQAITAAAGLAIGGHVTPGGLRVSGHYLYQLTSEDWFDGAAAFTFGSGSAACFVDRDGSEACTHGIADGDALELQAGVRRFLVGQGKFLPFLRAAIGIEYLRFGKDDVSGVGFPLHVGGGVRAEVADGIAVIGMGEAQIGIAAFGHALGTEAQFGFAVTAGAEFRLK
jgi:hypothetical protein